VDPVKSGFPAVEKSDHLMPRKQISLYLGTPERTALDRRPPGTRRGTWINQIAAHLVSASEESWAELASHLAPRPEPTGRTKLSVALPACLAADLVQRLGHVPLTDILRTALLRAARVVYEPVTLTGPRRRLPRGDHAEPTATQLGTADPAKQPDLPRNVTMDTVFRDPERIAMAGLDYYPQRELSGSEARWVVQTVLRENSRSTPVYPAMTVPAERRITRQVARAPNGDTFGVWFGIDTDEYGQRQIVGLDDWATARDEFDSLVACLGREGRLGFVCCHLDGDPRHDVLHARIMMYGPPHRAADLQPWILHGKIDDDIEDLIAGSSEERLHLLERQIAAMRKRHDEERAGWARREEELGSEVAEVREELEELMQSVSELVAE